MEVISRRKFIYGVAGGVIAAGVVGATVGYLGAQRGGGAASSTVTQTSRFPVGYYQIHNDPSLNFRLNFWFNCYYAGTGDETMLSEMKSVAPEIQTYADWKRQFLMLAEKATSNRETLKAAYYYRAAEFFMPFYDPDRQPTRLRFLQLARSAYGLDTSHQFAVPYTEGSLSGKLPGYRLTPANPKGTLVMFGGYDSYIEELVPQAFFFRDAGYDVILFEGPGQGGAMEDYGLPMTYEWEKPVAAVLDHFGLDNVSLMGISLGGYLVIRAAAFETRVHRVIADDIIFDFLGCVTAGFSPSAAATLLTLLKDPKNAPAFNAVVERGMQQSLKLEWFVNQGMHNFGVSTPFEFFHMMEQYSTVEVSGQVKQKVLLLAGSCDLDVPVEMFNRQIEALGNVGSLTARLFTEAEQAQNHCQVGNIGLQLNIIVNWLDTIDNKTG